MIGQDPDELVSDVVGLFEGTEVEEATPAPVLVHALRLERVEHVYQRDVVAIWVSELALLTVGNVARIFGPEEDVGHVQTSHDGKGLVHAVVSAACREQNFRVQRVHWQLAHGLPDVGKLAFVVESAEVVELLEGSHEGLWRRRIHVVEMNDVVDAKFLQVEDNGGEVGTLYFRVRILLQVFVEGSLCIESVALSRASTSGSTSSLLCTCPTNWANEK